MAWASVSVVLVLISTLLVGVASLAAWFYMVFVAKPKRIIQALRQQGIQGPPFRALQGNMPEAAVLLKRRDEDPAYAAATTPTPLLEEAVRQHGPVVAFCLGPFPRVVLADPSLIRAVYITHSDVFHKPSYVRRVLPLFGNGLVTANGADWQKQRRLLMPAFKHAELKRMHPTMLDCTLEAVASLRASASASPSPGTLSLDAEPLLASLTLEVICRCAFGARIGSQGDMAAELLAHMQAFYVSMMDGFTLANLLPVVRDLPIGRNRSILPARRGIQRIGLQLVEARRRERAVQGKGAAPSCGAPADGSGADAGGCADAGGGVATATATAAVAAAEAAPPRVDLLALMLDATEEAEREAGGRAAAGLSSQDLLDECCTFLLAGHETTANTVAWAMMLLAQHPEWQERAREEARQVLGAGGGGGEGGGKGGEGGGGEGDAKGGASGNSLLQFERLGELKLLGAILNETLRLYPVVGVVVRTATKTVRLSDRLTVPEGCDVAVSIAVLHRMEEYWGADALEFRPERFLGPGTPGKGAFMPFTIGPRTCIGQNFAIVEAKTILAYLLVNFSWTLCPSFRLQAELLLTVKNKFGIPVVLTVL